MLIIFFLTILIVIWEAGYFGTWLTSLWYGLFGEQGLPGFSRIKGDWSHLGYTCLPTSGFPSLMPSRSHLWVLLAAMKLTVPREQLGVETPPMGYVKLKFWWMFIRQSKIGRNLVI